MKSAAAVLSAMAFVVLSGCESAPDQEATVEAPVTVAVESTAPETEAPVAPVETADIPESVQSADMSFDVEFEPRPAPMSEPAPAPVETAEAPKSAAVAEAPSAKEPVAESTPPPVDSEIADEPAKGETGPAEAVSQAPKPESVMPENAPPPEEKAVETVPMENAAAVPAGEQPPPDIVETEDPELRPAEVVAAEVAQSQIRPMTQALLAISARDYVLAFEILMENAEAGNPAAQEYVAEFYARGLAVPKDPSVACSWFDRAAQNGNQVAKAKFARCFLNAEGRYKDADKAIEILTEAADAASGRALCALGRLRAEGDLLPSDSARGMEMCRAAAELGDSVAQVTMGDFFRDGRIVVPNPALAREWYEKAANHDNAEALFRLGEIYRDGTGVAKDAERAAEMFIRAAEQGHGQATFDAAATCFELIGLGDKKRRPDGRYEVNVPYIEKAYRWSKIADRYNFDFRRKNLMWRIHDLTRSFLYQASPTSVEGVDREVEAWKPAFRLD